MYLLTLKMPIEIDIEGKDIDKIIEEVKEKAKGLMKENKLGGFLWKRGLYAGIRIKGEDFYRIFYKCPNCGFIGFVDEKIKKRVSRDKPMLTIKCKNCGYVLDEIKKIPIK